MSEMTYDDAVNILEHSFALRADNFSEYEIKALEIGANAIKAIANKNEKELIIVQYMDVYIGYTKDKKYNKYTKAFQISLNDLLLFDMIRRFTNKNYSVKCLQSSEEIEAFKNKNNISIKI